MSTNKLILIVMVSLVGCNYGSSIANDGVGGGSPFVASGGVTGSGTGGDSTGGTSSSGGDTATGGSSASGTGGSSSSTGGVATGGNSGTGGSAQGGSSGADAGRGGSAGSSATGGTTGTGGSVTGGTVSTGGAAGAASTGGTSGTGGSTSACVPAASPATLGKVHNPGKDCIACHGSNVPTTVAGTLYDKTGATGVSGATVTVTGNDGKVLKLVTASNGNFWTKTAVAFPAKIEVSKCPDTSAMVSMATNGSCNSCHKSGGATSTIHLP